MVIMQESVEKRVLNQIDGFDPGKVFFSETFLEISNAKAINKALELLAKKDKIARVATGIYTKPKISDVLGRLTPPTEDIAAAIAKRDRARIVPTGNYALHALGLSTQVPLKIVYLTDGASRKIDLGNRNIIFKKTAPKNLEAKGPISRLVIQALKAIGKNRVQPFEEKKIATLLSKEKKEYLEHDILLAPEWIRKIMRKSL